MSAKLEEEGSLNGGKIIISSWFPEDDATLNKVLGINISKNSLVALPNKELPSSC